MKSGGPQGNATRAGLQLNSTPPIEQLVSRLENVRQYGKGYRATCPAHGRAKNQALSIAVADDGRVLIHCFAGCTALEIVQALGLQVADLFEKRIRHTMTPQERRDLRLAAKQASWAAALETLEHEARVVQVAGKQIKQGEPLNAEDDVRLDFALKRLTEAGSVLRGR